MQRIKHENIEAMVVDGVVQFTTAQVNELLGLSLAGSVLYGVDQVIVMAYKSDTVQAVAFRGWIESLVSEHILTNGVIIPDEPLSGFDELLKKALGYNVKDV